MAEVPRNEIDIVCQLNNHPDNGNGHPEREKEKTYESDTPQPDHQRRQKDRCSAVNGIKRGANLWLVGNGLSNDCRYPTTGTPFRHFL
jgi:hypothetical protein